MRNAITSQRGFGLVHIIVGGILIGVAGLAAIKIGKPYADVKVLQKVVDRTLATAKNEPTLTANDLVKRIFDQANIQSVPVEAEQIQVKMVAAGEYAVKVNMVSKTPLWKGAYLMIELSADGQTK